MASEKANLARIRDNQRRSRARRKEYLHELEEKYRNCELLGVEASSEIQHAARRVAEENKRLRALLRTRGVFDDEIDDQLGKLPDQPVVDPAAPELNALLTTRKPCCGQKPAVARQHSESSSNSSRNLSGTGSYVLQVQRSPTAFLPSDSVGTPLRSTAVIYSGNGASTSKSGFPLESGSDWMNVGNFDLADELSTNIDTSSCEFAASMLSSIRGNVSTDQVKTELGCVPGSSCKVDNLTLFQVMDKYSAQHTDRVSPEYD